MEFVNRESELKIVVGKYDYKLSYANFKNFQSFAKGNLFE